MGSRPRPRSSPPRVLDPERALERRRPLADGARREPGAGGLGLPSFVTVSLRRSSAQAIRTSARVAEVWRRTFESASATIWNTSAASRSPPTGTPSRRRRRGSRSRPRTCRRTGAPTRREAPVRARVGRAQLADVTAQVWISASATSTSRATWPLASSVLPLENAFWAAASPSRSPRYGWMTESWMSRAMRRRSSSAASERADRRGGRCLASG